MTAGLPVFTIKDYGATGDGIADDTPALKQAISNVSDNGGGTVYIPPGRFLVQPFELVSNMTLYLEAGAVLLATPNPDDYGDSDPEWNPEFPREGILTGVDLENVTIAGRGQIDGNGLTFVHDRAKQHGDEDDYDIQYTRQGETYGDTLLHEEQAPYLARKPRPGRPVRFYRCRNLVIRDVTIANAPTWTVFINECQDVRVLNVTIHSFDSNNRVPNDDGIDFLNCHQVRLIGCYIDVGDDAVVIFGGSDYVISDSHLKSRSAAVRIGWQFAEIRNVILSNLNIEANRGIGIFTRHEYSIENVLVSNVTIRTRLVAGHWWGHAEPIHISAAPFNPNAKAIGQIKNLRFNKITIESESGILIYGGEADRIEDVSFDDVTIKLMGGPLQQAIGGNFDLRAIADLKEALFSHDIPALFARNVNGLTLRNFHTRWDEAKMLPPFFTHAVEVEGFRDLHIDNFSGEYAPIGKGAAIKLSHGQGATIERARTSGELVTSDSVSDLKAE